MSNVAEFDKNFKVEASFEREGLKFYNCMEAPFKIYGVFRENGKFRRVPEDIARNTADGVEYLSGHAAGGRIRFKTDSSYVAISTTLYRIGKMPHFAFTGSIGFDMYVDGIYTKTFTPRVDIETGFDAVYDFSEKKEREILINFPLYTGIIDLFIGLEENSSKSEPTPYVNAKPIVYYGSSITQGGCASRPGTAYPAFISRRFNCDYINLGFSGNARGEMPIVEYIKNLDMSIFVLDYDHNANSPAQLEATHERMFKAVREAHPDIPIIMMPRPKIYLNADEVKRAAVVRKTYENAVNSGDRNVYYIDGDTLMALCGNEGTVDNCHPTDFGFASMAKAVGDVIEKYKLI